MVDTTKPRPPTVTGFIQQFVNLEWGGATDNVSVTKYEIWEGTRFITSLGREKRSYRHGPLMPGTYRFRVVAYDAAGNRAPNSNEVEVTIVRAQPSASAPTTVVAATTATQTP